MVFPAWTLILMWTFADNAKLHQPTTIPIEYDVNGVIRSCKEVGDAILDGQTGQEKEFVEGYACIKLATSVDDKMVIERRHITRDEARTAHKPSVPGN